MWEDKSTHKSSTLVVDDSKALIHEHFLDPMVILAKIMFTCFVSIPLTSTSHIHK